MGGGISREEHERLLRSRLAELRDEMTQAGEEDRERVRAENAQREAELMEQMRQLQEVYNRLVADEEARRRHAEELRNYPIPEWMNAHTNGVNIGIVGSSGTGKSLLNNRLRGLKNARENPSQWAKTGETETTLIPKPFVIPGHPYAHFWDLPGVGTARFPQETYFRDVGLRHFQALLIVCSKRFTEAELALRDECQRLGLPVFFVRTHMDSAVENEADENGLSVGETMVKIREYLRNSCGAMDPYLLALRGGRQEVFEIEMSRLRQGLTMAIEQLRPQEAAPAGGA